MTVKKRLKLKQFAKAYVKHKFNGRKAVLAVYDKISPESASSKATELLKLDNVKSDINYYLTRSGYDPSDSISRLIDNAKAGVGVKCTAGDSIRADELLLKASKMLIERKQTSTLNIDISNLDKIKLLELRNKYNKLIDNK